MFVSLLVSNSIVSSLHKLTDFAENIGSGIFEKREFNLIDKELDLLAANMNIMAYKLDRANIEQKTFFQNASHELRTPLMSIQGYAEGLKLKVFDDPDVALDVVISESKRLTSMVENLLAISRLDMVASGMRSTAKSTLNIRNLIESVVEKVRGSFLLSHIELKTQIELSDIYIFGNENDLFRALENILSNAIRHCKSKIDLHIGVQDFKQVYIRVSDDGPGITDEILPKIFDRFVQGDGGKHGIGLALVKAIIDDHHGKIIAENSLSDKTGAIFTVLLPIADTN
jgi:signal transduction histidine kinase